MQDKFSASTNLYYDLPMPEAVIRIAKLGFHYVELYRHSWEFDDITGELKGIFKNFDITPLAWHDHHELLLWADNADGDIYFLTKQIKQRLDICAELNIPNLILHYDWQDYTPGVSPDKHFAFKAFPEILELADKRGVAILIENTKVSSEFICKLCRMLGASNMGICLDIGHANLFESIEKAIRNAGDLIKFLHISDNFGMRKDGGFSDLHLAPGEGSIDWKKCIQKLIGANYDGVFNFELNGSQYARDGVADIMGWRNYLPLKERDKLLKQARNKIKQCLP
jgi:sugar phosphate isomerase/epimerase